MQTSCVEINCWSVSQQSSCGKDGHANMKFSVVVDCDPVVPETAQWLWKDSSEGLNKTFSSAFRNLKHVNWFGVCSLELRLWHTVHLLDCCYCSFVTFHYIYISSHVPNYHCYLTTQLKGTTNNNRSPSVKTDSGLHEMTLQGHGNNKAKTRLISIFWYCVLTCTYYSCIGITIYSVWY